jgi:arylsulfatase A-like enzyme
MALAAALVACERAVPRAELAERFAALGQPHLVLIVVDTLRADWTTPYGDPRGTSPELARWAARGAVFEEVRSQSSWTKISMASLMTSLWPHSHGLFEARDALSERAVTLAEQLHDAGYRCYAVQSNGWLDQSFGFHQGFESYVFPRGAGAAGISRPQIWPHADRIYQEAARLIDQHDPAQPMFLYLHFMDVHEYAAPPEFRSFGQDTPGAYLAAIRWDDDALARVREKLDDAGLLDRTVMVFASDHGEAFGEHGKQGHARNALTATLKTPLVIRFPFPIEPLRISSQVRNVDIAPTLLELAGVPVPEVFQGRSLLPLLTTGEADGDRVAYAALGRPLYPDASIQASVSDGRWTYARNLPSDQHPGEFLFDLSVDPGENVNLIEREPEQARKMRQLTDDQLKAGPLPGILLHDVRIDPSIAERLRAMGYLQ